VRSAADPTNCLDPNIFQATGRFPAYDIRVVSRTVQKFPARTEGLRVSECRYCDQRCEGETELSEHLAAAHDEAELRRVDRQRVEHHTRSESATTRLGRLASDGRLSRRGALLAAGTALAGAAAGVGATSLRSASSHQVADWTDLDGVRGDLGGSYELVADLDEDTAGYDSVAGPTANGGAGFDPIGTVGSEFTGTFDGNGHTIAGLYIDRGNDAEVGLFGAAGGGSTIRDVALDSPDVTGKRATGALVGASSGTVTRSAVYGGTVVTEAGGIDAEVGGIVGVIFAGKVELSQTSAVVDANGNNEVGGFAGDIDTTGVIENCYAAGGVTNGGDRIGGLLGDANQNSTITDSYATGSVGGTNDVGGLIGRGDGAGPNVTTSYWDEEATGQTTSAGGTGLTTVGMTGSAAATNMSGFDFSSTWQTIEAGEKDTSGDGYPILRTLDREAQLRALGSYSPPMVTVEGDNVTMENTTIEGS
jgi:hypothetical protein